MSICAHGQLVNECPVCNHNLVRELQQRVGELEEACKIGESIRLINVNRIHENDKEITRLRKALAVLKEMIKINGDNANTVQMHELIDEALKEAK